MTDFSSDATRRARRNLLVVSITLLLVRGFDSQVRVIAGITVNATTLGISSVLAIGVIYFLAAHFLYWRTDLAAMRGALLGDVLTNAKNQQNELWHVHHAITKWERDYRDIGVSHDKLASLLKAMPPQIEAIEKIIGNLHDEARLNSRLVRVRYYFWDFGLSATVAILSILTAIGWIELHKFFLLAGWVACQ